MVRYIISQGLIPVKLFFLHFIRALTSILCNIGTINQNVTSKKTVILSAVRSTKSKNLMEILRLRSASLRMTGLMLRFLYKEKQNPKVCHSERNTKCEVEESNRDPSITLRFT